MAAWPGELFDEFRRRAVAWAYDAGADVVVISGAPVISCPPASSLVELTRA